MISEIFIIVAGLLMLFMLALIFYYKAKAQQAIADRKLIYSQKKSGEVRLGQIAENLVPFLEHCKDLDPKTMHFIGNPIDYIVFDTENIIILEVKTGKSRLSEVQKRIKNQVEQKKIVWKTIRID